jgi:hypothetical protein
MSSKRQQTLGVLVLAAAAAGSTGCSVLRPVLFWQPATIRGKVTLADEKGTPVATSPEAVTVNFINTTAKIEESVVSVNTDALGKYQSPKLTPGLYKVEAFLPGHVIETQNVKLRSHEKKGTPFTLKKIRETRSKTLRESDDDNIPNPGDVQIAPPGL